MNFLNNQSYNLVRYTFTLIALCSIIIGFFMGKVAPEIFYATVGGIISHFYQETTIKKLNSKVKAQNDEIKVLKNE